MQLAVFLIALALGYQVYASGEKSRLPGRLIGIIVMLGATVGILGTAWTCVQYGSLNPDTACSMKSENATHGDMYASMHTDKMPMGQKMKGQCPFPHKKSGDDSTQVISDEGAKKQEVAPKKI